MGCNARETDKQSPVGGGWFRVEGKTDKQDEDN